MRRIGVATLSVLALAAALSGGAAAVGLPNPASAYCLEIGGTLEMREETGGTVGYCRLPDGRVVEEWTLFRQSHPAAR